MTDDCSWERVLEVWPNPLPSLADAAILAIAVTNRYDAVATFDKKLARRAADPSWANLHEISTNAKHLYPRAHPSCGA